VHKTKVHISLITFCLLLSLPSYSAKTKDSSAFTFDFLMETYIGLGAESESPYFLYNYKKPNDLGLNLFMFTTTFKKEKFHANLGIMAGDFAWFNLAHEPVWVRFIYQANVEFRLHSKKELWLTAGIFPSHIGFESVLTYESLNASRSLVSENSPYYESGLKLFYKSPNKKLEFDFLVLNGWQTVVPQGVFVPASGLRFNYKPKKTLELNYSNYIGLQGGNSDLRTYHNFYLAAKRKKFSLKTGFDIGTQNFHTDIKSWHAATAVFSYKLSPRFRLNGRGEYFNDFQAALYSAPLFNGIEALGLSMGIDNTYGNTGMIRLEVRYLKTNDIAFQSVVMPLLTISRYF